MGSFVSLCASGMVCFEPFSLRGLWTPCMVFSWCLCDRSWLVPSFLAFLSLVKVKYVIKLFLKVTRCAPFPRLCCLCGNGSFLSEGDLGEKIKTSHRCTRQQQQRERERSPLEHVDQPTQPLQVHLHTYFTY